MAFELLTDRLQSIFKKVKGQARLSEANMEEMLREVRLALLEADVNLDIVKDFIEEVKTKMIGKDVLKTLSPGQMVVKIVNDEIIQLLGKDEGSIAYASSKPTVILIVGLQGGGKTTTATKLAHYLLKRFQRKPMLVACDIYRPAAIDQLETLAKQAQIPFYAERDNQDVVAIAKHAYQQALSQGLDTVIIDTAGRLHIDTALMQELKGLVSALLPQETLLVVDAMSGQDAVHVATSFDEQLHLSGLVMTKLDGDARGGAALSIRKMSGVPIKFAGVGEKMDDFELFSPRQMADRILGMGDILKLAEKAQEIDEKKANRLMNRMLSGQFDLEDMLDQLDATNKMGPLGGILKMIPGMPKVSEQDQKRAEIRMKKTKAVIHSMTSEERRHPDLIRSSRKERIASGSGLTTTDVNNVLRQYEQSKQMMRQMSTMMGKKR